MEFKFTLKDAFVIIWYYTFERWIIGLLQENGVQANKILFNDEDAEAAIDRFKGIFSN